MVDRDIVLAKIATVDRCLQRLDEVRRPDRGLDPIDVEDLVEINLQRAVQATIDIAAHVVASEGLGLSDSVAGSFTLLEKHGILDPALTAQMRKMVGFRNIAVYKYQEVDEAVVQAIIDNHLDDLRRFCAQILEHYDLTG